MKIEAATTIQPTANPALGRAHRVLILGGTGEASRLAAHLSAHSSRRRDLAVITSLAGRVEHPTMPAGIVRVGGFGGLRGLIAFLEGESIDIVIDATHPFAAQISNHADPACKHTGVPLIALERPAWTPQPGDRWLQVPDVQSAASLLNSPDQRALLSVGRQELGAFSACRDAWFLVRAIDRPTVPLPRRSRLILSRGPFYLDEERRLLQEEGITHIVSKNSGGAATYPKIEAARELGIAVIMVERPATERTNACADLDRVYARLEELLAGQTDRQLALLETTRP